MTEHILKCPKCGSYGLSEGCSCGSKRVVPKPPKYSPEDKYGKYRRLYKEKMLETKK
ncbi:MAG: nucleolar RNA-binding Nop10p family protein [archaeon]